MDRAKKPRAEAAAAALATLRATSRHAHRDASAEASRRDPRVAPLAVSTRKTVSIAESCRFYGSQDAISTCRVPRSCQDCLQMPDCVITADGVCQHIQDVKGEIIHGLDFTKGRNGTPYEEFRNYDYHGFLKPYPNGTAFNITLAAKGGDAYFFATNATYCAPSDPVCTMCRACFKEVASSADTVDQIRTQFCVGGGGCVCVAVCEVPELLAFRANDTQCHEPLQLPVKRYDKFNGPSRAHHQRDPRTSPEVALPVKQQRHPSCAFLDQADVQGRREPRTCGDCLAQEGCMISLTGEGMCTSMDAYSPKLDFRARKPAFQLSLSFPSNSTSYCPPTDKVCAACRKELQASASNGTKTGNDWTNRSTPTYCIGENGCVCIEQCEANAVIDWGLDCDASKASQLVPETCEFYGIRDAKGCLQRRNCGDCLDKEGCMISINEKYLCSSMDEFYSEKYDFRTDAKVDFYLADAVQFPANATAICPASDPVCAFCREQFRLHPGQEIIVGYGGTLFVPTSDASFCVGRDGCVCIDRCENSTLFMQDARDTRYKMGIVRDNQSTAIGVLVSVFLTIAVCWSLWRVIQRLRAGAAARREEESRPRPPVGLLRHMLEQAPALQLDLYGWRRFQQVLLTKEQELLAGAADVSPVARPVDFDYEAVPTAPDFDEEDDASAPTATNPHALASAPCVHVTTTTFASQTDENAPFAPSAPDFD